MRLVGNSTGARFGLAADQPVELLERRLADADHVGAHRGERRRCVPRHRMVVVGDDAHILGHADAGPAPLLDGADRHLVVGEKHRIARLQMRLQRQRRLVARGLLVIALEEQPRVDRKPGLGQRRDIAVALVDRGLVVERARDVADARRAMRLDRGGGSTALAPPISSMPTLATSLDRGMRPTTTTG